MPDNEKKSHLVAMVGAGPAGIYATRKLAEAGHTVVLLNRDIKPGGMAEYGIYLTKYKMKEGLRKQFRKIFSNPRVNYFGHVTVGDGKDITLKALKGIGISTIVISAGAQGTKKLGIPGEDCTGVYHAKDVVYHFNNLPPFSERSFEIGRRVAIVGMGNVMVDIANWLIHFKKAEEVLIVARRGPVEKAYDEKEFDEIRSYLDVEDLRREVAGLKSRLEVVGQNAEEALAAFGEQKTPPTGQRFRFRFFCSPRRVIPNAQGGVGALEVEENELVLKDGRTVAQGLGRTRQLEVDSMIYAIGDQVDPAIGIPFSRGLFVCNPGTLPGNPNPAQYQAYDPGSQKVLEGIFLVGWSRKASVGIVGISKQDAERGMKVVNAYLDSREGLSSEEIDRGLKTLKDNLRERGASFVTKEEVGLIEAAEEEEASKRNLKEYKFASDREMLDLLQASGKT